MSFKRRGPDFCIYLIGEAETRTLIKAYIQLALNCRRSASASQIILTDVPRSAESSGFTLRLEQGEDVSLSDRSLHVSDQGSVHGAHELHLNLRNTTSRAYIQTRHYNR